MKNSGSRSSSLTTGWAMSLISGSSVSSTGGSFTMALGEGSSSGGCLILKGGGGTGETSLGSMSMKEGY